MRRRTRLGLRLRGRVALLTVLTSCHTAESNLGVFGGTDQAPTDSTSAADAGSTSPAPTATSETTTGGPGSTGDGPKFDLGTNVDVARPAVCVVVDDMSGVPVCTQAAPPDSFEPDVQWAWFGDGSTRHSATTPLVVNLTDDDTSGGVDLCDTPDVVVSVFRGVGATDFPGHIYVFDGETGALHFKTEQVVDGLVTPAVGDIDNDGLPEIVTALRVADPLVQGYLIAFEHDGSVKWTADWQWEVVTEASPEPELVFSRGAVALADLDNDGDVEIIADDYVADHDGNLLWKSPEPPGLWPATTAADLDGDGDLEVVLGHAAYHHDGVEYYVQPAVAHGYPQIADLDDDPEPEVLVTNQQGLTLLEHDGTIKYQDLRPTGDLATPTAWRRPATIHDFDGDGDAEFAVSSAGTYAAYEADASILWAAPVDDPSGIAAGTAFDFLGDGVAEAMYADEQTMFAFDGTGAVLMEVGRSSITATEYPTVADVDNDGSAEIVVVSNGGDPAAPTVRVVRDVEDRWIPARRIWNQHTYHVSNVREDGTIPQFEPPHWELLNTFRTNAQLEAGKVCRPAG